MSWIPFASTQNIWCR